MFKSTTLLFCCTMLLHTITNAQKTNVKQLLVTSGGIFNAPGNRVHIGTVRNSAYTVFDSVYGDFSNACLIDNPSLYSDQTGSSSVIGYVHVGRAYNHPKGKDLLITYDMDTYARKDSITLPGIQALAAGKTKIVVIKGFGADTSYIDILNKYTLRPVASVPFREIRYKCTAVTVQGDTAYVAYNFPSKIDDCAPYECYSDSIGFIAAIDMVSNKIARTISLGQIGAGVNKLFFLPGNKTILLVGGVTAGFTTQNAALTIKGIPGKLAGVQDNSAYSIFNKSLKKINEPAIEEIAPFSTTNLEALCVDTASQSIYALRTDYSSFGSLTRFSLQNGARLDSVSLRVSSTAFAIDYRATDITSFKTETKTGTISAFPNPCSDKLYVKYAHPSFFYQILNAQGNVVLSAQYATGQSINTSSFSPGLYHLIIHADDDTHSQTFIKQ